VHWSREENNNNNNSNDDNNNVSFKVGIGVNMAVTYMRGLGAGFSARVTGFSPRADISRQVHIASGKLLLASSYPSFRTYHSASHWTDFHEIWIRVLEKINQETPQICIKSDKNPRHLT
jgi:hypothetical protein